MTNRDARMLQGSSRVRRGRSKGDSREQRVAEYKIRSGLEKFLRVRLDSAQPDELGGVELDGYASGRRPVCVEVWAHQGPAKPGQRGKVMRDMCKLLLAEKLLGRRCQKIIAATDSNAIEFLTRKGWCADFAKTFGIDVKTVPLDAATRRAIRKVQVRQYR